MNAVFSRDGWRRLRLPWAVLVLAIAAAAVVVYGSHWYVGKETRDNVASSRRLQEARSRVDRARRERESLLQSVDVFRTLVDRGLLQSERRLDLVELVNVLRSRHQLFSLDYEIAPQRVLQLAGGRVFPSIDVLSSRVKLRARALHEGDLLGFMQELSHSQQGFYPVDWCSMRRMEAPLDALQPHVEMDCRLEWITLRDKNGNHRG